MLSKNNVKDLLGKTLKKYDSEIVNPKITAHESKIASTSANGHMTSAMVTKLNGIQAGAEVNQNAISNIKVGSTTLQAASKTATLELAAGENVTLTPDAATGKVTIASKTFTKSDVGLGNVTNESKATMFTNAALTGVPTAPTAAKGTSTSQIATTAFVADAISKIAAEGHTHVSSEITAMTGYVKASTVAALSAKDSLNVAMGKLEKNIEAKMDIHTHPYRPETWVPTWNDVTNKPDVATAALASAKIYADGIKSDLLGGADSAFDTLKELEEAIKGHEAEYGDLLTVVGNKADKATLTSELAKKADNGHKHVGSDITAMTGYVKASAVGTLSANDSLNVAMGKLEKNIEAKMDIHTHPYRANTWVPAFAEVTSKPNTLAGYGITDAATSSALSGVSSRVSAIEARLDKEVTEQDITDIINFIKG